jgi:hypothetical protein
MLWIEAERAKTLQDVLDGITASKFIRFEGETFNTADIEGVYRANTIEEYTRRKNGQWKCEHGSWHERIEKCSCRSNEERRQIDERRERIKQCGKCQNGWILDLQGVASPCECQKRGVTIEELTQKQPV